VCRWSWRSEWRSDTQRGPHLAIGKLVTPEHASHRGGHILRAAPTALVVRMPAQRERRDVLGGNDEHTEPRPPHLHQRGVVERGGLGVRHPAWIDRSAARGMLSCRPAHATVRSEAALQGNRSFNACTVRRKARICSRETRSGVELTARCSQVEDRQSSSRALMRFMAATAAGRSRRPRPQLVEMSTA